MNKGYHKIGYHANRASVPRTEFIHGTATGYSKHMQKKIPVCEPCRIANAAYRSLISVPQYLALINNHFGMCWNCGYLPATQIDHNHDCKKHGTYNACPDCIRGMLCYGCNIREGVEPSREFEFYLFSGPIRVQEILRAVK